MTRVTIDPFERKAVPDLDGDELNPEKRDLDLATTSYLEKLRLNLVISLGSPWRVKYDLIERNIAILNMIESDREKLHDSKFLYVYERISNSTQRELEKLDKVWKDLTTKRSSQDQLRAFQNIEIFIDFLTELGDRDDSDYYSDELIRQFIGFLKVRGLFVE